MISRDQMKTKKENRPPNVCMFSIFLFYIYFFKDLSLRRRNCGVTEVYVCICFLFLYVYMYVLHGLLLHIFSCFIYLFICLFIYLSHFVLFFCAEVSRKLFLICVVLRKSHPIIPIYQSMLKPIQ